MQRSSRLPAILALAGIAFAGCQASERDAPNLSPLANVVLVTLDTVRADHLGCYGYRRPTTPFLDALARDGIRFTRAFTSSPHTAPAHASILTSLQPEQHRVLLNGPPLDERIPTLASVLGAAGYQTAAFVSIVYLKQIARSFDVVDQAASKGAIYRRADETVDAAIAWLKTRDARSNFFLWIHLFDAHEYEYRVSAPAAVLERIENGPDGGMGELHAALGQQDGFSEETLKLRFDIYDAQIAFLDAELQRLFDHLRDEDLEPQTLWVVTADHGEGMGDHGHWGHGVYLYNEQVRVPLIFYGGRGRWKPRSTDRLVRHVDLLPTIAELLGVVVNREALRIEGHSVSTLLDDPDATLPIIYAVSRTRPLGKFQKRRGRSQGQSVSAQGARYKYIRNSDRPDEFYDLDADPGETTNLVTEEPVAAKKLGAWLSARYRDLLDDPRSDSSRSDLSEEQIELLEKLGYL